MHIGGKYRGPDRNFPDHQQFGGHGRQGDFKFVSLSAQEFFSPELKDEIILVLFQVQRGKIQFGFHFLFVQAVRTGKCHMCG